MQNKRNPQNILVTGGAGFIGSAFIRYLLRNETKFTGHCINLDLLTYAGNRENLLTIASDSRYLFQHGDICNQELVEGLCAKHKIDTIINFAAESHVDRSIDSPQSFIQTNIVGTFHLLEVVKKNPHIHFHQVSTDEVYGSLLDTGLFSEESPYKPNSPYAASKASADHLVRSYAHTYPISTCISNCTNNYGPYQFPEKLVPLIILNCLQNKPLPVYGKGLNIRDWIYVDDHAEALWILLKQGKKGETYNVGSSEEWRNIDLVHEIIKIIAKSTSSQPAKLEELITFVKDRPGHDLRYALDCTKIKKELGWQPKHKMKDGLKLTVEWYVKHHEWIANVLTQAYRQWIDHHYANT